MTKKSSNLQQHLSSPHKTKMSEHRAENEIKNIGTFVRCGLLVLSVILVSSIAIAYGQNQLALESSGSHYNRVSQKKLPIYCVDQEKPKIALSFDAAWGERR